MNNKLCTVGSMMSRKSWWKWALFGLLALYALLLVSRCSPIEQDLQARTTEALNEKGMNWASTSLTKRGRDVMLSGVAPSEAARNDAIQVANDVYGVRVVDNDITLKQYSTPIFGLNNDDGKTTLSGSFPEQKLIDQAVRVASDNFGADNVINKMTVSEDVSSPSWLPAALGVLPAIISMKDADLDIKNDSASLEGTFHTDEDKQAFMSLASSGFGDKFTDKTVITPLGPTPEELAEIARKAEEAEAARLVEEQRLAAEAEASRLAEEKRLAEAARIAEEQRLAAEAEATRIANEKSMASIMLAAQQAREAKAEAARLTEEKRLAAEADAARTDNEKSMAAIMLAAQQAREAKAEAARLAEEKRLAAEAEAARIAEEQRLAAEAEAARIAEEQRLAAEAEATRIANEKSMAAIMLAAQQAREAKTEAARVAEEQRLADEAEAARIAEEQRLAAEAEATRIANEKSMAAIMLAAQQAREAKAEAARLAEEKRLAAEAEAARIAEEQRLAAEAEATRIANEKSMAAIMLAAQQAREAKAKAEAARLAEEKRLTAEAEAARIAEEQRLAAEKRLAEEARAARLAEQRRLDDIAKAERAAERKRQADLRAAELAKQKRLEEQARAAALAEERRIARERAEAARLAAANANRHSHPSNNLTNAVTHDHVSDNPNHTHNYGNQQQGVIASLESQVAALAATPTQTMSNAGCQQSIDSVMRGQRVLFATSSSRIDRQSYSLLNTLARNIRRCEKNIQVAGHTDSRGAATMNMKLSQDRARAVRDYLRNQGVGRSVISSRGYGETRPIANNNNAAGRRLNRRIQFTILR